MRPMARASWMLARPTPPEAPEMRTTELGGKGAENWVRAW